MSDSYRRRLLVYDASDGRELSQYPMHDASRPAGLCFAKQSAHNDLLCASIGSGHRIDLLQSGDQAALLQC